jgi:soluble lytic murein transglycosylase-like protein
VQKHIISLFVVMAVVLSIAPNGENGLGGETSSYLNAYSEAVERAILKSIVWADDAQIRRLASLLERKYGNQINKISKKYYACPEDIKAITIVESLTDEDAKSSKGALGLMGFK